MTPLQVWTRALFSLLAGARDVLDADVDVPRTLVEGLLEDLDAVLTRVVPND